MTQDTKQRKSTERTSRFGAGAKKMNRFSGTTGSGTTGIRTRNGAPFNRFSVRAPRIRMVTPRWNFVVDGVVFILIDAAGDLDPTGSLKVEVQIDEQTTIKADYSATSGYYGAIWDSTLTANVSDSAGNSNSTHTIVSVG
jgi:hypothetical protein